MGKRRVGGREVEDGRGEGEIDLYCLGLTGETTIFKRRGDVVPSFNNEVQHSPKRIQFVMDVSGRYSLPLFTTCSIPSSRFLSKTVWICFSPITIFFFGFG